MHDKYFEGIVQLRNCNDDDIDAMRNRISLVTKINQEKKVRNGYDYYITSKRPLRKLMAELKDEGCEVKISRKLHTRDTKANKDLYRVNLLIRLPAVRKGDVVLSGRSIIKVTSVSKKIAGLDITTGKRKAVNQFDEILEVKEAVVSKIKPQLEVIHPETFQSIHVENQQNIKGKKVSIVEVKNKVFIVPSKPF